MKSTKEKQIKIGVEEKLKDLNQYDVDWNYGTPNLWNQSMCGWELSRKRINVTYSEFKANKYDKARNKSQLLDVSA